MRVSEGAIGTTRNGGFIHRLSGRQPLSPMVVPERRSSRHDLPILAERYRTAVNPAGLARLADKLGVSITSLNRLRVGWAYDHGAWSFPMRSATGHIVGIRLRLDNGRKFAVTGGREGLFVPDDLPHGGELLIAEGPTDCAALLDLGFAAVGRPSCTGGVRLLVELVTTYRPAAVVVVADGDAPGRRGAVSLASVLSAYRNVVKIIWPPDGIKDARAWKISGATAADVRSAIDAARLSGRGAR